MTPKQPQNDASTKTLDDCPHKKTRVLYEQRPPSEGRKLKVAGRKCEDCGKVLESKIEGSE